MIDGDVSLFTGFGETLGGMVLIGLPDEKIRYHKFFEMAVSLMLR
jgi:hypothetical protein